MGDTLTLKWSKEDADRKAWAESQPEGATAALVRAALDALWEQRSHGGGRPRSTPSPTDSPDWIIALMQAVNNIPSAVKQGVIEALQTDPTITVWQNAQVPVTATPEPIMKAKRPTKNHHQPVVDVQREDSPEDLEEATGNFMSMFG